VQSVRKGGCDRNREGPPLEEMENRIRRLKKRLVSTENEAGPLGTTGRPFTLKRGSGSKLA
jgi:hypothetical protein